MATRFETFSEDEISAIIEVVAQTNTKKAKTFGLSVFTGRQKIISMLNLQQNRKMHLQNPRNVCKFLLSDVFNLQKVTFLQYYAAK